MNKEINGKPVVMEFSDFTGGINSSVAPQLLAPNEYLQISRRRNMTTEKKYLDKSGFAYYHYRMSKATVNITQSAHQTIDCFIDYPEHFSTRLIRKHSSNDWLEGRYVGLNDYNWQHNNPENQKPLTESFDLKNGQELVIRVKPDSGYKTGALVVKGGFISYRWEQEQIDQNNADFVVVVWCPGDVINVSATPATLKSQKRQVTITTLDQTIIQGEELGNDYVETGIIDNDEIRVTFPKTYTEVGTYDNVATYEIISDADARAQGYDGYEVTMVYGKVYVNPAT